MHIQLNHAITDLKGFPLMDGTEPLTMRAVLVGALLNAPDSAQQDMAAKRKRYTLATNINNATQTVYINVEETKLLMDVVAQSFSTLVVGRVLDELDPPKELQREIAVVAGGSTPD